MHRSPMTYTVYCNAIMCTVSDSTALLPTACCNGSSVIGLFWDALKILNNIDPHGIVVHFMSIIPFRWYQVTRDFAFNIIWLALISALFFVSRCNISLHSS